MKAPRMVSGSIQSELYVIHTEATGAGAVGGPEKKENCSHVAQVEAWPVVQEIAQANANGFELIAPAGAGPTARSLIRRPDASPISAYADVAASPGSVVETDHESTPGHFLDRERMARSLCCAEGKILK